MNNNKKGIVSFDFIAFLLREHTIFCFNNANPPNELIRLNETETNFVRKLAR